jgi:hypothetical protein
MTLSNTNPNNFLVSALTDYQVLDHAYKGSDGFKDGGYLTPHWREKGDRYQRRRNDCWYLNVFKPIIDAHVESIYKIAPKRELNSDVLEEIEKDIDGKGNSANVFFKRSTRQATLQGKHYILVDNVENPETNKAKAIEERSLPYVVMINRDRVEEDETEYDKFGNILKIKYSIKSKNEQGEEITNFKIWTPSEWVLENEEGKVIEGGSNNLGIVPIVEYFQVDSEDKAPQSDFFHVAKAAFRVFNLTSNIQEQEDNQMYSILTLPKDGKNQKNLGTSNALTFHPDARKGPDYIAPNVEPIKVLIENVASLVVKMYDMSSLAIIKGLANASGESKRWDYEKTETVLAGRAMAAEIAEVQVWNIIQKYLNLKNDIGVTYTRKFTFVDADKEIEKALSLLEMNLGPVGNAEVKKVSAFTTLNYIDSERMELINDSIDEQAKEDEKNIDLFDDSVDGE